MQKPYNLTYFITFITVAIPLSLFKKVTTDNLIKHAYIAHFIRYRSLITRSHSKPPKFYFYERYAEDVYNVYLAVLDA